MAAASSTDSSLIQVRVSAASGRAAIFVRMRSKAGLPVGVWSVTTSACRSVSIRWAKARSISTAPAKAQASASSWTGRGAPSSSCNSRMSSSAKVGMERRQECRKPLKLAALPAGKAFAVGRRQ